jgi:hypothetical protein
MGLVTEAPEDPPPLERAEFGSSFILLKSGFGFSSLDVMAFHGWIFGAD